MTPRWVSKAAALAIHELLMAEHGGSPGILDEGLLDAALANPKNHLAYAACDIYDLAAACAFSITRYHPFNDGHKRVALTVAGVFLELNGYRLEASEVDAVGAVRALAEGTLGKDDLATWLRANSSEVGS